MKNQYQHTPEVSKEAISAWYKQKLGNAQIIIAVIMPISFILMFLKPSYWNLLLVFMTIFLQILYILKRSTLIKTELNRIEVLYKDDYPQITVELGDRIYFISGTTEREVQYCDVKKVVQTKNLIVLILKGEMTISLRKDGFVEGTVEECLGFLKTKNCV